MSPRIIVEIVVLVAVIAIAVLRRSRRARHSGSASAADRFGFWPPRRPDSLIQTPDQSAPTPMGLLPLPGDVGLVAARELRERLRGRAFRIGTVLILAVIAAAIVIPAIRGSKASVQRVGVAGALSAPLRAAVVADGSAAATTVTLVPEASQAAAEADLRGGRIDIALIDGRAVVTDKPITANGNASSATAKLASAVARTVGTADAMRAAGLTAAQAAALGAARAVPVTSLQPAGPGTSQRATSLIGLLLVFFLLTQYNTWTLIGVLEEKSSRVVEVLLAAVPPARLLAGKVLGIGLTVFLQAGVAVVAALAIAHGVHSDVLHGTSTLSIAATLAWLVLGYAFYSWVYAAAGAMASRQDQVQSLAFPLGLPVIFAYIISLTAATSGNASLLVHVLAYLPPTAPLAMPVLVGLGAVSWWQFAASALISLACTVGVAAVAASVYQRAILQTGRRVRLREALAR
jgi:ABC-2 type transport system permease protein